MADPAHTTNSSAKKVRRKRASAGAPVQFIKDHMTWTADDCVEWPFSLDQDGYGSVGCKESKLPSNRAHRLMCIWVHGDPPFEAAMAAHFCGNRRCINPKHLRWATVLENSFDRYGHGTMLMGETATNAKLTAAQALDVYRDTRRQVDIAKSYGVAQTVISKIKSGRAWSHVTGHNAKPPKQRLSEEIVRAIRAASGPLRLIAERYRVSLPTVKRIKRRSAWKCIDE